MTDSVFRPIIENENKRIQFDKGFQIETKHMQGWLTTRLQRELYLNVGHHANAFSTNTLEYIDMANEYMTLEPELLYVLKEPKVVEKEIQILFVQLSKYGRSKVMTIETRAVYRLHMHTRKLYKQARSPFMDD